MITMVSPSFFSSSPVPYLTYPNFILPFPSNDQISVSNNNQFDYCSYNLIHVS